MGYTKSSVAQAITEGRTYLGIELGSTRIKAVLIDEAHTPIASGAHDWTNSYIDGIWTYSTDEVWAGIADAYAQMAKEVLDQYDVTIEKLGGMGYSAMMHGYMAFDENDELLVPFRTWRNNITGEASESLTKLFNYPIPQRWSIAHLSQAIINEEEHVKDIKFLTTLAGYVHYSLTGQKVLGVGEASGMFPIDLTTRDFNKKMIDQFDTLVAERGFSWKLGEIMPKVMLAGDQAGVLTEEGAKLLDPSGKLQAGVPMCPPEGDAGTGMVATNSVAEKTGNVSAGTSVFAMIVLEKDLSKVYSEIDQVTTPTGKLVAMAHSNNCSSNLDAWIGLFEEAALALGAEFDKNKLYQTLYTKALSGAKDGGGLLAYGYLSGEHITHFEEGRPLFVRNSDSQFDLANFMRTNLMSALGALKIGLDILLVDEQVQLEKILGHGGFFKTKDVGQTLMAAAVNAPVTVMETAGEGGAWGIAILAAYMAKKTENQTLEAYLDEMVFGDKEGVTIAPSKEDVEGFDQFMQRYKAGLPIERAAVDYL